VLRWLLPLLAVMTLLGASVTAWAAAGVLGEPSCCCPIKAECRCHDHDDDADHAPTLKRCGGSAVSVAPAVAAVVVPPAPVILTTIGVRLVAVATPALPPTDRTIEPETPPF